MPYIYQNHLDDSLYSSDEEIAFEDLYCETCNEHDTCVGSYNNAKELKEELINSYFYNEDYIDEFLVTCFGTEYIIT